MLVNNHKPMSTYETPYGRYYYFMEEPTTVYPSVSTVVHGGGSKKRSTYTTPYAAIGTLVHWRILQRYTNERLDIPRDPIHKMKTSEVYRRIDSSLKQWDKLQMRIKPICVERAVFSKIPPVAGRLDMFCYLDGVRTLLDIKTGKEYPDNPVQISSYVNMLNWSPKQAALVYLDADLERNPEQEGHIKLLNKYDLEVSFGEFKERFVDFDMPDVSEIIKYG